MNLSSGHIIWFIAGLLVAFLIPALFGNNPKLSRDLYYLIYFVVIGGFLLLYVKSNNIKIVELLRNNFKLMAILTIIFSVLMVKNVLSNPVTSQLTGASLFWATLWRGLLYGLVDGTLLSVFPYLVVWNTFNVYEKSLYQKTLFGLLVYVFVIIITTSYHFGYKDFRSKKLIGANIGNSIISTPTVITGNPLASPVTHAAMHIAAVWHSPETGLFLPPHRN